jgi:membrane-associated protease RseP (regulator of RpoE activity)
MRRFRYAALLAVAVATSTVNAQGAARGVPQVGGRASTASGACQSNPWEPLGIAKLKCESCTVEGQRTYLFDAEPVVESILANSALRAGDVILAINARPITTREGGMLFSNPPTGSNTVTVRRSGAQTDIVAQFPRMCSPGSLHISAEKIEVDQGRTTMSKAMLSFQPGPPAVIQARGAAGSVAAAAQLTAAMAAIELEAKRMQAMKASDTTLQQSLARLQDQVRQLNAAATAITAASANAAANAATVAGGARGGRGAPSTAPPRLAAAAIGVGGGARGGPGSARGGRGGGGGGASAVSGFNRVRYGIALDCNQSCVNTGTGPIESFTRLPKVSSVAAGSPAAQADLRVGDQVVAVNGIRITAIVDAGRPSPSDAGTAELTRVWSSDVEFKLTVLRDAKEIELTIKP